ncbi:MAG: cytochrome c family protein [Sphingomonadales bacterium]|nr:cytochrome c family protein [Sphingomonadales bacterium]PIX66673.1 MAG: cytochrome c family protein [Sphingomonadales bacterium CG_4_10_14_3_um_filter_58_15]NCO48492.1 cytochrome c family protein [Sphingomonadales bacterium]NCO99308.1 cytochrome c family protein [Sphingomonadales bacterium]NCP27867.1 cytochrome c family protein [Sphingomonadales bacterium]
MSNNNTIAGWVLAGGIAALGFSIVSGKYFHAGKHERPEVMGYVIEGVETADAGADAGPSIETLLQTADIAAGEKVFGKCAACHTINQGGANGIGPNLWASMGKPHGHVAGFAYSDALKSIPGNWDWTSMNAWLTSPRKYADGTKMTFAGLGKAEDRANLMVYLNAQGSNLPLPAAPVVEETPVEGDEAGVVGDEAAAETAAPEAVAAVPAE